MSDGPDDPGAINCRDCGGLMCHCDQPEFVRFKMPFGRGGKYQSEQQAEREEEENHNPAPLVADPAEAVMIRAGYESLRRRVDDRHAFDGCCDEFGYKEAVMALAGVSEAARKNAWSNFGFFAKETK